jgi:hypothetical protein
MAVLALSACPMNPAGTDGGAGGGSGGGTNTGGGTGGGGGDVDAGYARSAKGNLRFKGDIRLTIDLAVALGLPFDQVCNELGQYACTYFVHPVALGGVDPYGKGIFESPTVTGVTTAVVVERVALSSSSRSRSAAASWQTPRRRRCGWPSPSWRSGRGCATRPTPKWRT